MKRAGRRILMERKIVELLISGAGVNYVTRTLHVSKTRVRRLREQAKEHGYLDVEGKKGLAALPRYPEAVFPDGTDGRALQISEPQRQLDGCRAWMEERLQAGWHAVTVHEELPVKVGRSSFYRYLEREKLDRIGESYRRVVPEIVHRPGEALLVDWGKLRDAIDPATGKRRTLWMFTGILGYSRYLMVRLVWSNDLETTLKTLASMFEELGGVPMRVTTDNPKCFALLASVYEPVLNPGFERFAGHYGFLPECLAPAAPEKKGKIERPMPYVRRLYEAHGEAWHGLEESQAYLDKKMAVANERKHGTTLRRPREIFRGEEAAALKPLPALAYEVEIFHEGVVRKDGHVRFLNKYYSMEEKYIGEEVAVIGSATQVCLYHQGRLIEVHPRLTGHLISKSTKPQHLKPWEQAMADHSIYRERAARLGPSVEALIITLLKQGQGFIDTRKIWGILSLDKSYAPEKINEACRRALAMCNPSYRAVRGLLEFEDAPEPSNLAPETFAPGPAQGGQSRHKFVRPLSVYQIQLPLPETEGNA